MRCFHLLSPVPEKKKEKKSCEGRPPRLRMSSAAGDDPESAGTRTPASSAGEASSGRWTRSRGRLLAAENTGPAQSVEDSRGNRRRVEGFSVRKKRAAAGSERVLSAEEVALAARPLPPLEPPFPKSGQHDDVVAWSEDLMKLGDEGDLY